MEERHRTWPVKPSEARTKKNERKNRKKVKNERFVVAFSDVRLDGASPVGEIENESIGVEETW